VLVHHLGEAKVLRITSFSTHIGSSPKAKARTSPKVHHPPPSAPVETTTTTTVASTATTAKASSKEEVLSRLTELSLQTQSINSEIESLIDVLKQTDFFL
jgi:hypothetical protein